MNGIKIFDSQNNPIEIESDYNDIQIDSSIKKIKIVKDGYYSKEIIFNEYLVKFQISFRNTFKKIFYTFFC